MANMIKYFKKAFYFSIPIVSVLLFIVVIDPYEFVDLFHVISPQAKIEVLNRSDETAPRGNMLWKTIHFKREPKSKLIIGDSQGRRIKESLIKESSGEDYFNYCVEGASFETMIDVFWFAAEQTKLKKVFFQVGFMNYNANRSYNLFHFGIDYLDKPYIYFTTPDILLDSYYNLIYRLSGDHQIVEHSYEYMKKEDLEDLSEFRLNLFFGDYKYPEKNYTALNKISDYCKANEIELNFLVLPVYAKTIEYIEEHGLKLKNLRFKEDLARMGNVYYFQVLNEPAKNRDNFIDYFHPKQHILDDVTREVWGKQNNK
jgi:hypothetical protein